MKHFVSPKPFARLAPLALLALLAGCAREPQNGNEPPRTVPPAVASAIARYFEEIVAPSYGGDWEHCIPLVRVVAVDDTDPADIRAWGDYEVWNYRLDGDTLQCVSGGSHPGLARLRKADGSLAVTEFEPVPDGADFLPGAKRIFGKHFAAWQKISSDSSARDEARRRAIADYISTRTLPAKFFQDYGWPPVPILPQPLPTP